MVPNAAADLELAEVDCNLPVVSLDMEWVGKIYMISPVLKPIRTTIITIIMTGVVIMITKRCTKMIVAEEEAIIWALVTAGTIIRIITQMGHMTQEIHRIIIIVIIMIIAIAATITLETHRTIRETIMAALRVVIMGTIKLVVVDTAAMVVDLLTLTIMDSSSHKRHTKLAATLAVMFLSNNYHPLLLHHQLLMGIMELIHRPVMDTVVSRLLMVARL